MAASNGEISCESDSNEKEQLVRSSRSVSSNRNRNPYKCRYRLIKISGKGALFMIIYNAFFSTTLLEWNGDILKDEYGWLHYKIVLVAIWLAILLCLSIGFLSETCLGRYKFLTASLYLWLTSVVFMALEVIGLQQTFRLAHLVAEILSATCYIACALPFTIDQLVGASGEELSFTIYWIGWSWSTFGYVPKSFDCHLQLSHRLRDLVLLSLYFVGFLSAYT